MRRLIAQICVALLLSGCAKSESLCSADSSKNSAVSLIKDQIYKSLRDQLTSADANAVDTVSPSSIKAAINQLTFAIDNIRTADADPNSTKRHCDGDLSVIFPVDIFNKANAARQSLNEDNISQFADKSNVKADADKFSGGISYSVQPTDDKKNLYTETQGGSPIPSFVAEVVANSLLAAKIEQSQQQQKAQAANEAAQQAASIAAKRNADLGMAQADNRLAMQTIGAVWQSLPPLFRHQILPQQKAWIAKTRADCHVQAASASIDPTEQRTAQLSCESQANMQRADELKRLQPQGFQTPVGQNDPLASQPQ